MKKILILFLLIIFNNVYSQNTCWTCLGKGKITKEIGLPVLIVKTGQVLIKVKYHVMFVRIIEVITLIIILLFVKHAKELVMMKN